MNTNLKKEKNKLIILSLTFIAFFSSFKNVNIYLFGNNQNLIVMLDYFYFILVVLVFSIMFFEMLKNKKINTKIKYFVPLTLWIVTKSALLTLFVSGEYLPRNLIAGILTMGIFVLGIKNKKSLILMLWAFIIGAFLSALIPLILSPEMIGYRSGRVDGVEYRGGFWNFPLISFISTGWLIIALIHLKRNKKTTFINSLFLITITIAAFSGLSRSLLLAVSVSVLFYLVLVRKFRVLAIVTVLGGLLLTYIPILFPFLIEQYQTRVELEALSFQDEPRIFIWQSYLNNIPQFFLFGALGDYRQFDNLGRGPHSVLLNWLVQYGIIGFLGFTYFVIGIMGSIRKVRLNFKSQSAALAAWLVAYLSLALINQTGFFEASIYTAFGLIIIWGRVTKVYEED
ncbi:O-antigen ligase family protein [Pontibacillus salipaludis]|uniref:O-antigen ligase family protein n=1 Tax=Pontibacillus salipaludis TaxID=1697394 RepID=UPI0031ED0979